jgi:hypothetical protein
MSEELEQPCKTTPKKILHSRLMNPCIAKTEIEHYAVGYIKELEAALIEINWLIGMNEDDDSEQAAALIAKVLKPLTNESENT